MIKYSYLRKAGFIFSTILLPLALGSGLWFASANSDEEKAVRDVLLLQARSVETGDLKTLDTIWSHDESVLVFESGGMNKGWKDYRDNHLGPELRAFKNTKFSVSEVQVKVDGNTAWGTYRYALSADYKARKINSHGLGTMIFSKTDGKWLIVHSHTSAERNRPD